MNRLFWAEIRQCFDAIATDDRCRVVVLSGAGKNFTGGLDLQDHIEFFTFDEDRDVARRAIDMLPKVKAYQDAFTALERCMKPVIAAVHNACVGGGIDLICAADVRYCSADAWFCVKEVDIGLAADVGTLQRFPKVIGNDSLARELAYTARNFGSNEAKDMGLVSRVLEDRASLQLAALETAKTIASKSPVAVQGTKYHLVYARDHGLEDALHHQAVWNSTMLQSEDLLKAAQASMTGQAPTFSKL